jgi:hypothetical protein
VIIDSWDGHDINDGANYEAGFVDLPSGIPAAEATRAARSGNWPLLAGLRRPGRTIVIDIILLGNDRTAQQVELAQWFDPEDETPKQLWATTAAGSLAYVEAVCEELREVPYTDGRLYLARLAVHGDVRWRSVPAFNDIWIVDASGDQIVIDTATNDLAFPTLSITPTSAKSNDYAWKRWVAVRWRVDTAFNNYPVDLTNAGLNTAALVSGGKMQADGDDLRVFVNGTERDRWLDGMNTTTTKVWANLSFKAKQEAPLAAALAGTGAVDTIDVDGDVSGFPSSGILMVDSEAFLYMGKNNQLRRFTGVVRAQRGTSMAAHSAGATAWWVQHDIFIVYGNAAAGAPPADAMRQPTFDLQASSNILWNYERFAAYHPGKPNEPLPLSAQWRFQAHNPNMRPFSVNFLDLEHEQFNVAGIAAELPFAAQTSPPSGRWILYNPCGITGLQIEEGMRRYELFSGTIADVWTAAVVHSKDGSIWIYVEEIDAPSVIDTSEDWGPVTASGLTSRTHLGLWLHIDADSPNTLPLNAYLSANDCEVTLDSNNTPTTTVGAEQGNYHLDCTITNETTGEAIHLLFNMALDETLTVDTANKLVTYSLDGASYFGALTMLGGPRRHWLPLVPGANTLRFDDAGTNDVVVATTWRERYYG